MSAQLLTTAAQVMCPHGGRATLMTSNTRTAADMAPVLLETDIHVVAGCTFTLPGPKPSPCVRIEWNAGATTMDIGGVPPLLATSVGLCYSPESAPQGTAVIGNTQTKAAAS